MIALTSRQRNIIEYLLKHDGFVTNDEIAAYFNVSNRTIRKDLDVISNYLNEQGMELVRKPGSGIFLDGNINDISFEKVDYSYSKEERVVIYTAMLLLNEVNTYVSLSSSCGVSKQTVINDLNNVEIFLKDYHIEIIKNQGIGTSLKGNEKDIRRCFIDLLFTNKNADLVIQLCLSSGMIQDYMELSKKILEEVESKFQHKYVEKESILIILSFIIGRIQSGHSLTGTASKEINNLDVEKICQVLSKFQMNWMDQEYISTFLLSERVEGAVAIDADYKDEAIEISEQLVSALQKIHYFEKEDLRDIIQSLTIHMRAAIYRCRNNIHIRNELNEQVRFSIGVMYEFTKKELSNFEEKYDLSFDQSEISYIALYLASIFETGVQDSLQISIMIICTFGLATSSILKSRMYQIFGDCKIIGPYSIDEAKHFLQHDKVDLVISTNYIDIGDSSVIYINPLLKQNDIEMIRTRLFQESFMKMCSLFFNNNGCVSKEFHTLGEYIKRENIRIYEKNIGWEDAIRKAAEPLVKNGDIENQYVTTMIHAVNDFGTYMVVTPKVAYVHAGKEDGVNRNCVSLLVLKDEIPFGSFNTKSVVAIVVLGICDKENSQMLNIANILDVEENVELLQKCKDIDEILKLHD